MRNINPKLIGSTLLALLILFLVLEISGRPVGFVLGSTATSTTQSAYSVANLKIRELTGGCDLKTDAGGYVYCGVDASSGSGDHAFPFTGTDFGSATTTVISFTNGLMGFSTSTILSLNSDTITGIGGGTNALEFSGTNAYFLRTSDAYSTYFYQSPGYSETLAADIQLIGDTTITGDLRVQDVDAFYFDTQTTISEHPSLKFFDIQTRDEEYTLARIKAPTSTPYEATIALLIDEDGDNSGVNESFFDWYNENYADSYQAGLRLVDTGTARPKPIVFGHYNDDGISKDEGNKLVLFPSGTVWMGQGTSTANLATMLHVGSTTASNLLRLDGAINNVLTAKGSGNLGVGTGTPATKLDIYHPTATSTHYIYSGGAGLGGRVVMEDSDGAGCTEITTINGTLNVQTITCPGN